MGHLLGMGLLLAEEMVLVVRREGGRRGMGLGYSVGIEGRVERGMAGR